VRATAAVLSLGLLSAGLATALTTGAAPASAAAGVCDRQERIAVPGAEAQVLTCLAHLTTRGTVPAGRSNPAHFGLLDAAGTQQPTATVPGLQVDGYFPDTSTTNTHATLDWKHDSQFVIRLPESWNGGLVVAGTPGNRGQYANDRIIADTVLAKGYAYAATDKGNTGPQFYLDGERPGDAVAEWHERLRELTEAAKKVARQAYGHRPSRTFVTGLSNGGYLTRYALENSPGLYDGGVDAEGTLFTENGPNLFTYLPTLLREYPAYRDATTAEEKEAVRQRLLDAGLPPGSEPQWAAHHTIYWDLTQRIFREEFDPAFDGGTPTPGTPFCTTGATCDAQYDYLERPDEVREAVGRVSLDGKINDPLITVHGTQDALLPIELDSDVYAGMILDRGRDRYHRYYRVEGATHVDGLLTTPVNVTRPDGSTVNLLAEINKAYAAGQYRPLLPCYRKAFEQLERWVYDGEAPPPSGTIARRPGQDEVNTC
jgi:dienelactone hydrolase